jgi:hypothetical protein
MPPVAMPEKGVVLRHNKNGTTYVYYTLRAYRNSKGAPTSETALIGKLCPDSGRLIPNKRYYELFPDVGADDGLRQLPLYDITQPQSYLMDALSKQIGVTGCLKGAFPSVYREILTIAFHIANGGDTRTVNPDGSEGDLRAALPGAISLLDMMSSKRQADFFERWAKQRPEREYQCFNVSMRMPGRRMTDGPEWGDCEAPEDVYSVWMFIGKGTALPRYYNRLPVYSSRQGIHVSAVQHGMDNMGIRDVGFCLEKRFVTAENIGMVCRKIKRMVCPWPADLVGFEDLIEQMGPTLRHPANWLEKQQCYGNSKHIDVDGQKLYAHLYYDALKAAKTERVLYAQFEKEALTIEQLERGLQIAGYSAYLSNDPTLATRYIPRVLVRRAQLEDLLESIRTIPAFWRLSVHNEDSKGGRSFIAFLALTLRLALLHAVVEHPLARGINYQRVFRELHDLPMRNVENPTPIQRTMLTILDDLGLLIPGQMPSRRNNSGG